MKKMLLLLGLGLFLIVIISIIGPYNLFNELNEEKALKQFISEDKTFQGLEVMEMDYRGSDTYFIQAKDGDETKHFIVMNYHSSVMNGHWKVFEQISEWNYY